MDINLGRKCDLPLKKNVEIVIFVVLEKKKRMGWQPKHFALAGMMVVFGKFLVFIP